MLPNVMSPHVTGLDIAVRLALTMVAGGIVGFNRGTDGHAAGLRTTILVTLAAAVAMIQMNILLGVEGKDQSSFSVIDVARLPLGILTGVGFIGAGAIFRRGNFVSGVTTAATLWIATIIGLCFGGGQIALGATATALTAATLWLLKWVETLFRHESRASLVLASKDGSPSLVDLNPLITPFGYRAQFRSVSIDERGAAMSFDIFWFERGSSAPPLDLFARLCEHHRVVSFERREKSVH
jgi:putative Mg2+ transporter-C (MgtC) family protein